MDKKPFSIKNLLFGVELTFIVPAALGVTLFFLYKNYNIVLDSQTWKGPLIVYLVIFLALIGLTQLIYVIPLMLILRLLHRRGLVWGLLIGAVLVILSNVVGVNYVNKKWEKAQQVSTFGDLKAIQSLQDSLREGQDTKAQIWGLSKFENYLKGSGSKPTGNLGEAYEKIVNLSSRPASTPGREIARRVLNLILEKDEVYYSPLYLTVHSPTEVPQKEIVKTFAEMYQKTLPDLDSRFRGYEPSYPLYCGLYADLLGHPDPDIQRRALNYFFKTFPSADHRLLQQDFEKNNETRQLNILKVFTKYGPSSFLAYSILEEQANDGIPPVRQEAIRMLNEGHVRIKPSSTPTIVPLPPLSVNIIPQKDGTISVELGLNDLKPTTSSVELTLSCPKPVCGAVSVSRGVSLVMDTSDPALFVAHLFGPVSVGSDGFGSSGFNFVLLRSQKDLGYMNTQWKCYGTDGKTEELKFLTYPFVSQPDSKGFYLDFMNPIWEKVEPELAKNISNDFAASDNGGELFTERGEGEASPMQISFDSEKYPCMGFTIGGYTGGGTGYYEFSVYRLNESKQAEKTFSTSGEYGWSCKLVHWNNQVGLVVENNTEGTGTIYVCRDHKLVPAFIFQASREFFQAGSTHYGEITEENMGLFLNSKNEIYENENLGVEMLVDAKYLMSDARLVKTPLIWSGFLGKFTLGKPDPQE